MPDLMFNFVVETDDGIIDGEYELWPGTNIIVVDELKEGAVIKGATGWFKISMSDTERLFMNGYQTWTHCPEYARNDKIRGIHGLPQPIIDKFRLDRYGDYHFVKYPNKSGWLHGVSYGYFRHENQFRLFASVNEENGYTLFEYNAKQEIMTVTRDCAGYKTHGGEFAAFELFYEEGSEEEVFDAWFEAMEIKRLPAQPIKGYSSWYNRYENIDEKSILSDLEGCARVLDKGDLFQIDDGWEPNVGDWLAPDEAKFPNGLKHVADKIHHKGFKAGLWLAPFVCRVGSEIDRYHPDWILTVGGEKWMDGSNWGGFYSLDIDNPEVEEYIRRVFRRVFDEWGFDLVKLDFLYGAAPFGNENETRAGRMYRAMRLLREVCGDHPILGCGVPVMPAFGLVEYCRVSCDVSLDWNDKPWMRIIHRERVSTKQALENSIFRRELNGRAFLSDPDVFFLRDDNISLTPTQKLNLAKANRLLGGVWLCSDDMGKYDANKRKLYRELAALEPEGKVRVDTRHGLKLRYKDQTGHKVIDIYSK